LKILAAGDSYMPSRYFAAAFGELERDHEVAYLDIAPDPSFEPSTPSERRLREYLGSPRQLMGSMDRVEVLAIQGAPVTDEVLSSSDALRLVCCARGGPVNVDVDAVAARGLPLVNTPGKNADAVADLTLAFLVMLARGLPRAQRFLEQGHKVTDNWQGAQFLGRELGGRTLGLIGYGQIGQRVAARAQAFGMTVLVFDPYVQAPDRDLEQPESLHELLRRSDFVSLHARATTETERLIDADALATMRPGAFLINTARETLVDETALDQALASGRLGGAALDVFEGDSEPGPPALLRHPNVVLTPHVGGATEETLSRGAEMIAEEIERFAVGQPLVNVVGRAVVA
jgi:D-3-phosphoglycerate dehydrogenase / 2-oxoglutarate reductase